VRTAAPNQHSREMSSSDDGSFEDAFATPPTSPSAASLASPPRRAPVTGRETEVEDTRLASLAPSEDEDRGGYNPNDIEDLVRRVHGISAESSGSASFSDEPGSPDKKATRRAFAPPYPGPKQAASLEEVLFPPSPVGVASDSRNSYREDDNILANDSLGEDNADSDEDEQPHVDDNVRYSEDEELLSQPRVSEVPKKLPTLEEILFPPTPPGQTAPTPSNDFPSGSPSYSDDSDDYSWKEKEPRKPATFAIDSDSDAEDPPLQSQPRSTSSTYEIISDSDDSEPTSASQPAPQSSYLDSDSDSEPLPPPFGYPLPPKAATVVDAWKKNYVPPERKQTVLVDLTNSPGDKKDFPIPASPTKKKIVLPAVKPSSSTTVPASPHVGATGGEGFHPALALLTSDPATLSLPDVAQPSELKVTLMPHQTIGLKWLVAQERAEKRRGGILADEMGLGKTYRHDTASSLN